MPKITREQIQKINEKCENDWGLDIQYFIFHNEKELIKKIDLDDESYLQFKIGYNWKNQISLYISKFYHKQGDYFATSEGLGKSKILDSAEHTRKSINNLIEYTKTLADYELMHLNAETRVTKSPMFIASEEF